jgi:glycosyltransferase involved in cell wall biosynthesis
MRRQAELLPNLCFHGRVPYSKVGAFYERARVFVNTSDSEGFPNSFLQAWVRGTPVISFFDPDGVIDSNRLGGVPRSMEEMIDMVRALATDDATRERVSGRCRDYMNLHYNNDTTLRAYLATFERLAQHAQLAGLAA